MFGFRDKSEAAGGTLGQWRVLSAKLREIEEHMSAAPAVPATAGFIYLTRNGSFVHVFRVDGRFYAQVIHGGHGTPWAGEMPGERYVIGADGTYTIPPFTTNEADQPMPWMTEGEEWKRKKPAAEKPPHIVEMERRARLMDIVEVVCEACDLGLIKRTTKK